MTGAAIAAVGAVGVGVGVVVGPANEPTATLLDEGRQFFILAPSALVTALGVHLVARSQATDTLAEQSASAIAQGKNEDDRYLYY